MAPRAQEIDEKVQRIVNKARFENYIVCYNALKCQCEQEYDLFINVFLWKDILEPLCERTHSQYGIVAIIRASMVFVNKEVWKAYLERRAVIRKKESNKRKNKEDSADANLKKRQLTAREQCIELIGEEFTKKWELLPPDLKLFLSGASKDKIVGTISEAAFLKNNKKTSSKKQCKDATSTIKNTSPPFSQSFSQSLSQAESQSSAQNSPNNKKSYAQAKQMAEKAQQQSNRAAFKNRSPKNKRNEYGQPKQFFRSQGPSNFKRSTFKPQGEVDPYSPDLRL